MKKILVVASCLDLDLFFGCTPAWWQLMKGLREQGVEILCTPYSGRAISTFWWQALPNPCGVEGEIFRRGRSFLRGMRSKIGMSGNMQQGSNSPLIRLAVEHLIKPKWRKHIRSIFFRHPDIEAVLVLTVPSNHFRGIPEMISKEYSVPVFYYDGDAPASLPEYGGFASGFKIYDDADLAEYTGVISNSEGALKTLQGFGAKRVHTIHWGADPDFFRPMDIPKDVDVGFYGLGDHLREEWIKAMIGEPSMRLPENTFAIFGSNFRSENIGKAQIGELCFYSLPKNLSRIKIHLNITRSAHAQVFASSSARLFEIAAMGGCIVSNPVSGVERWFEDDEICVVNNCEESIRVYEQLLDNPGLCRQIGEKARRRILDEHTYTHRAKELVDILSC